ELKQSVRATITDALANMDVVTREEFEIQQKVLARTRQKLEALEKRAEVIEGILTRENTNLD
ncbi:MAG: accessory factor UbiK family protein, partial [Pseudomonadales bacterium]|nr:accessory factor UbiK family protein [Pseudomonadales bacterium]